MNKLTDADIEQLFDESSGADEETHLRFARAIERHLRPPMNDTYQRSSQLIATMPGPITALRSEGDLLIITLADGRVMACKIGELLDYTPPQGTAQ